MIDITPLTRTGWLVCLALAGLIVFMCVDIVQILNTRFATRNWISVEGKIIEVTSTDNIKFIKIKYKYQLNNTVYINDSLGLNQRKFLDSTPRVLKDAQEAKTKGLSILVLVNPNDHKISFYDHNPDDTIIAAIMLLLFFLLLLLFLVSTINRKRNTSGAF
jgi:hypothetical protein